MSRTPIVLLSVLLTTSYVSAAKAIEPSASTSDYERAIAEEPCPDGSTRASGAACSPAELSASLPTPAASPGKLPCMDGAPRTNGVCPASDETQQVAANPLADDAPTRVVGVPKPRRAEGPHAPRSYLLHNLTVTFNNGSSELNPHGTAELSKFAAALSEPRFSSRRFEIAGHTDKSGAPDRNLALSQARADRVRAFLVEHGVGEERLSAKGYGFAKLAYPEAPFDARNRRVEAVSLN